MHTPKKLTVLEAINLQLGTELRMQVEVTIDNRIVYRLRNKGCLIVESYELDFCLKSFFELLHLGEVI